jgi:hypothetical protein
MAVRIPNRDRPGRRRHRLPLDDRDAPTRTVWINPSQIETVVEYLTWHELDPILWLELTLASGTVHYSRVGPVVATALEGATERAVEELLPTSQAAAECRTGSRARPG